MVSEAAEHLILRKPLRNGIGCGGRTDASKLPREMLEMFDFLLSGRHEWKRPDLLNAGEMSGDWELIGLLITE
jgi:hypothetical protein